MSETRSQQEPSMEEILASIRRIISEDGQEPQAKTERDDAAEQPEGESGAGPEPESEPQPQPQSAAATPEDEAEESRPHAAADNGDDVLVLTEMLAEDGSVVSLAARSASDGDLSATAESTGLPEPPYDPEETMAADRNSPVDAADPEHQPDRAKPSDRRSDADSLPPQVATAPSNNRDQQMESESVSNEVRKKLDLVSKEAETASTAALTELARTVTQEKELPPGGGGRMVEDLVREALQPMLREWLDTNLPGLVERLVRAEIQRMVRRAEDNA